MKKEKSDLVYLEDMRDAIKEIISFTTEGSRDLKTYRAIERNIEIIGEACSKVSKGTQEKHPHISWREIKAMRNVIVHEYSRVSAERVWKIADNEILTLLEQIEELIDQYS